jgi:hypothetical protein
MSSENKSQTVLFSFCSAGDQIQGLAHARQAWRLGGGAGLAV